MRRYSAINFLGIYNFPITLVRRNCWNFSLVKDFCIEWSKWGPEDDRFGEYVLYRRTFHPNSIIICCITLAIQRWARPYSKTVGQFSCPRKNNFQLQSVIEESQLLNWRAVRSQFVRISETHSKQLSLNTNIFSGRFRSGWYTERRINSSLVFLRFLF